MQQNTDKHMLYKHREDKLNKTEQKLDAPWKQHNSTSITRMQLNCKYGKLVTTKLLEMQKATQTKQDKQTASQRKVTRITKWQNSTVKEYIS